MKRLKWKETQQKNSEWCGEGDSVGSSVAISVSIIEKSGQPTIKIEREKTTETR